MKKYVSKIFTVTFALAMVFVLASCGCDADRANDSTLDVSIPTLETVVDLTLAPRDSEGTTAQAIKIEGGEKKSEDNAKNEINSDKKNSDDTKPANNNQKGSQGDNNEKSTTKDDNGTKSPTTEAYKEDIEGELVFP